MKGIIISGGKAPSKKILQKYVKESDIIIGADKGCEVLFENNIEPHIVVGDFDSIDKKMLEIIEKGKSKKYKFKCEKDFSDTESAYNIAIEEGCTEITLLGVTGTRYDHAIANIGLLLKSLKKGIKAEIIDDNNRIFLTENNIILEGEFGQTISFHSFFGPIEDLSIKNAKYELENYNLNIGDSRTVSNEFLDKDIIVSFKSGILMVLYTND